MAGSETCRLLIVTDDQIEVLRNLVNYAHQRRSWNDETIDDERYYLPSDEDWDALEALVADLENKLMSQCDFVTLDDTNDRLGINNVAPAAAIDSLSDDGYSLLDSYGERGLIIAGTEATLDMEDSITLDSSHIHLATAGSDVLNVIEAVGGGTVGIGVAAPNSRFDIGAGAITLAEMTPPGGTPANMCVLFVKDDGTGKTALIAKFNSVSRVLATE
jgi:hypothetical protein